MLLPHQRCPKDSSHSILGLQRIVSIPSFSPPVSCNLFTPVLRSFLLFLPSPPPNAAAIVSFQATIGFHSPCNLSHSFSFCDSVGIFSCLSAGSISTLSFAKCDLFCSSSLQHNRAVFIVCWERGREGVRKRQRRSGGSEWDKRTKQMSGAIY